MKLITVRIPQIFLCFCLLLLGLQDVSAQSTGDANIRFRSLAMSAGIEAELYFSNGSQYELLPLSHYRPSRVQTAKRDKDGNLLLFEKVTNDDGAVQYVPKRRVAIPKGSRQVLLIVAELDGRIGVSASNDNLSNNDKDWLFINTTQAPIALQLGENNKPISLPAGGSVSQQVNVETGRGAAVRVAAFEEDSWKKVYSTFWPIYEGQRSLVICVQDGKKIRVRNFFESVTTPGN